MVDPRVVKSIEALLAAAREQSFPVTGAVLHGSFARGEEHEWSDIDVIALLRDDISDDELGRLRVKLGAMAWDFDTRIELMALRESRFETDDYTPFIHFAREEGIRIAA